MTRQCSACGTVVARKECHRNRYAEYICRACQAKGIKFTPHGRRRHGLRRALAPLLVAILFVSVLLWVLWPYLMPTRIFEP